MELDRRAFVAAILAGGVGATQLGPLPRYLDAFAPLSGETWDRAAADIAGEFDSPHGAAAVRYDDYGVPTIEAESDDALYYATGYVHAADRLFEMDLFRRRMRGTLAAAVGERVVEDDVFHTTMDFAGAAEANWDVLEGTDAGDALEAYADGVNSCREDQPLPMEFSLLGYEPAAWTPVSSMLIEKQITWGLTGSFETLRRAAVAEEYGQAVANDLYPNRLDHDVPILRPSVEFATTQAEATVTEGTPVAARSDTRSLAAWGSQFESPDGIGSNSWVVGGDHTDSGRPLIANDPHLTLLAPPVWYEMHQRTDALSVSGVAFPGVPFVVIGENETGAWGFTNAGADVIDFYDYEIDGDQYRYGDDWREFETETRTVEVADGEDRDVEIRKTVHGPLIERHGERVGVAWTGFLGSRTSQAIYELDRSGDRADARDALATFDSPTQCAVYANRDGETYFCVTGLIPRRMTDGEPVSGGQIFDGSAMEGEWPGYEPYGAPDLDEGWIPFPEKPQDSDVDYLGTANQRIINDDAIDYYLAESYSAPSRARRIYDRLDQRADADAPFTHDFSRELQRDVFDERAALFVPTILEARDEMDEAARTLADELEGWDYGMDRDSRAALVFERFLPKYAEVVFGEPLAEAGFSDGFVPNQWVLLTLPADSDWFTDELGTEPHDRAESIALALERTATELDEEGWATYGDYNTTDLAHPFDQDFLNYPAHPTDGSPGTVRNFRKAGGAGSSYRLLARFDGEPSLSIIPGGNDGDRFSEHYHDQLELWADGKYTELTATTEGEPDLAFSPEGEQ